MCKRGQKWVSASDSPSGAYAVVFTGSGVEFISLPSQPSLNKAIANVAKYFTCNFK